MAFMISPSFAWQMALAGGCILAAVTSLNLALNGKITGMSGIMNGLLVTVESDWRYRLGFVGGIVGAGALLHGTGVARIIEVPMHPSAIVLSGLLVGFGSITGNGCTSGHGICGIPRLSIRSIVAVMTFMGTGIATSAIISMTPLHNAVFGSGSSLNFQIPFGSLIIGAVGLFFAVFAVVASLRKKSTAQVVSAIVFGAAFGYAMVLSGMYQQTKVLGFLWPREDGWDPSLIFVMGGGVGVNLISFNLITRFRSRPVFNSKFEIPSRSDIDRRLVAGAAIFGIGWGLGGLCPAPGLVNLGSGNLTFLVWVASVLVGMKFVDVQKNLKSKRHHK